MITTDNLKLVLEELAYVKQSRKNVYVKEYPEFECAIKVDFTNKKIMYPTDKGMTIHRQTTCNFSENENFVVLECITSLLDKGYKPEHIELEKPMPGGLRDTGGFCDIQIKDNDGKTFLLIECKKADEFDKHWKKTMMDGGQLFRYYNSYRQSKALCMYMSDYVDGRIKRITNIVSMLDNEELLKTDKSLKSFREVQLDNGDKADYFKVWKDTYQQDFATRGIFEKDIKPYTIGKQKYTVDDLDEVDNNAIQKKYHEFATILRQHNVGSHENAFDKLVNLFLAKIVDETINEEELQFYWKGAAYDDYFSLQDRLQKLYKEGMEKFLGEEVTYIDQKQVSDAFHLFKNDPDATRNKVLGYFRQLKFYTNSDFAFLDVHNEELFYQNAVILKKLVLMLEDMKLKTKEQNQFLGDLFEGFLDDGVKQSEGQYFTPLPIVKFIVSSLPIENIIKENAEIPQVIDYACGAGHFLTEYASYIKEYVEKYKSVSVTEYYKKIFGIEKEYRLSKVAKVSAFMYGEDDIQIIYGDALVANDKIEDGKFSVLIANPPYSVKGFLETLPAEERERYSLFPKVSDAVKNNSIETFFIERAKQLLKSRGVAAIILPISILTTKDNLYTACREIILKYFDIIAISEFAGGTFGKTPTNTVTLFLRRKDDNPDIAEHYWNRVEAWFEGDSSKDIIFEDEILIKQYCEHCEIDFSSYYNWLCGGILPTSEIFEKYLAKIKKSASYKKIENKRITSKYSVHDKNIEKNVFIDSEIRNIEKEKMYYYMLAKSNACTVVVSKTPSGKALKEFLGYDWSESKGNEGIKYLGVGSDDDTLENNKGIRSIETPLFNPNDYEDNNKINSIIRSNYLDIEYEVPDNLKEYVATYRLEDMIDFSRVEFNKVIKTNVAKKMVVNSKYKTEKISKVCEKINPSKTELASVPKNTLVSFVDMESISTNGFIQKKEEIELDKLSGSYTYFKEGDVVIAKITPCMENGKCALATGLSNGIGMGSSELHVFRAGEKVLNSYLFAYLNRSVVRKYAEYNMTGASGHRRVPIDFYEDLQIPVPDKKIQQKVVDECNKADMAYNKAIKSNEVLFAKIEALIDSTTGKTKKLGSVAPFATERVLSSDIDIESYVTTDNMLPNFGGCREYVGGLSGESVMSYKKGDILISNIRPYLKKIWYADRDGGCSPDVLIFRVKNEKEILPKFLYYTLKRQQFFDWIMSDVSGMKMPRGDKDTILAYSVTVPDINAQKDIINKIEAMEALIGKNNIIIDDYPEKKDIIIKQLLLF